MGVDHDDTVLDFANALCVYHNRVYGGALEKHHMITFHTHEVWGCTEKEALQRIVDFVNSEEHRQMGVVPGAIESLRVFAQHFELIGITARDPARAHATLELTERLLGRLLPQIHFLGYSKTKGDFCVEHGISLMSDDALHNAKSVGEKGIPVFLLDQPWNQGNLPPNTTRVRDWAHIRSLILLPPSLI